MKPDHRRTWAENEEFGRFKRWFRSTPRVRRQIKRYGHRIDRQAAKDIIREETRWTGNEEGWSR